MPAMKRLLWGILLTVALTIVGSGFISAGAASSVGSIGNGSFETGDLSGYTASGDVSVVESLGAIWPTDGQWMALLTTTPDAGFLPIDATTSTLEAAFQIPAGTTHLRFDADFLTNEIDPSKANDSLVATLICPTGQIEVYRADTLSAMSSAAGSGYAVHTDWVAVRYDVSAFAGNGQTYTLRFELHDLGDGRLDSAATIDQIDFFVDADGDGYPATDDCDDTDPLVNPGMTEIPFNNKDDDCNPATLDGLETDLVLTKTVEPLVVQSGDIVTYTLVYSNAGSVDAADVILTDNLPNGLTPGGPVAWSLGTIAAGQGGMVILTATVDVTSVAHISLINTATLESAALELDYGNNTARAANELVQAADLVVSDINLNGVGADAQTLIVGGTGKATIRNRGSLAVPANRPFAVTFFEDRDGDGAYDPAVDNTLGQATHSGGLAAGAEAVVPALVTGQVLFRDNLVYAFVDSGNAVAEQNETNNVSDTGSRCEYRPPVGQFNPVLEWEWAGSATLPEFDQVMMMPVVIDLTGDGVPEIVFSTFQGDDYHANSHLRAISGRDGSEIFTVTDPAYDVEGSSAITVGDIDLDGRPEILVPDESRLSILAFEHDGTFKWRSPQVPGAHPFGTTFVGLVLDDLDHNGLPEIITGAAVLNNDGSIRWADAGALNVLVSVANLDLTGDDEIIADGTAYRSDGSVYWNNESLISGWTAAPWTAIGNFDEDAYPEVVLVGRQQVYVLEHDGIVKWGPSILPGPSGYPGAWNEGGSPLVADVDGDGMPEIGVAGGYFYSVFEHDGTLKWSSPTHDFSSSETASSAFDFDGDGSVEVAYADELKLRVFRGTDGTVLWETTSTSGTTWEGPLVADVDADGNAEIVMGSNDYFYSGSTGIQVYGDANDTWVPTRQIWNQHSYHINNVNDDGTIPQFEQPSWLTHNTYRCQAAPQPFRAPDLTASRLLFDSAGLPASLQITARIGNGGAMFVGAGLPVAFYDGDPIFGGALIGVAHTSQSLQPGEYEDVVFEWISPTLGLHDVYVVADDDGTGSTQNECDETNNTHHQTVDTLTVAPDLVVPQIDRSGLHTDFQALTITGTIAAEVQNRGNLATAGSFDVAFFEDLDGNGVYSDTVDNLLAQTTHDGGLGIGESVWVSTPVSGTVLFRDNLIFAFADSGSAVLELDETNNLNDTGAPCQYLPPEGQFQPVVGGGLRPTSTQFEKFLVDNTLTYPDGPYVRVSNIDSDDDLDIAVTGSGTPSGSYPIYWYKNSGSNRDFQRIEVGTASDPDGLALCDLDNDNYNDIVVSYFNGSLWYQSDGDGNFSGPQDIIRANNSNAALTRCVDLDNDGDKDVIEIYETFHESHWEENEGGGVSFASHLIDQVSDWVWTVNAADLDNDGDLDLLGEFWAGASNSIYLNNGNEVFTKIGIDDFWGSLIVDLTSDSNKDLAGRDSGSNPVWAMNDGLANFTVISLPNEPGYFVGWGDFNGDSRNDLLSFQDSHLFWLENDGAANFTKHTIDDNGSAYWDESVVVVDIDQDGDQDIVTCYGTSLYIYFNLTFPCHPATDLTASYIRVDMSSLPTSVRFTARIGNGGANVAAAGLPIAFYDGDPAAGGTLLGVLSTTVNLDPGEYEDMAFEWISPILGGHDLYVVADDDGSSQGTANECDEANNVHWLHYAIGPERPDLVVPQMDRSGLHTDFQALTIDGTIAAEIENQGGLDVTASFDVAFFEDLDGNGVYSHTVDNLLGHTTYAGGLGIGESAWVSAPVDGRVLFRDNLIYAFVDSGEAISEEDEANNLNNTGATCEYQPLVGQFNPVLEWEWTDSSVLPGSNQVMMAPVVTDLTEDGIPDIVFSTYSGMYWSGNLRAISGNDGSDIFTITSPEHLVSAGFNIAVGDIDLDGHPEIVAGDTSNHLIAFEHDGTFKWRSPALPIPNVYGQWDDEATTIGDIDRDGIPEIVQSDTVLNNDGSIRWSANNNSIELSVLVDLDMQGDLEVLVGNAAYRSDGSLYWFNGSLDTGLTAVANFDADPYPEIVLVTYQEVYLLEHDGAIKWGPSFLVGGSYRNRGGPPVVADLDNDGAPEIGIAGGHAYHVFETDGTLKWSSPTQDLSSAETGSSVFDLEGDGSAEILYGDEIYLRIYRGTDGTVLWQTSSPSGTLLELPVVADVDADGNVEIIKVSNNLYSGGSHGIQVYGDANDTWVPTRQIWNQHAYHVNNVNDDGSIPQFEEPSWLTHNTYRCNIVTDPFRAPDLTASRLVFDSSALPDSLHITARIGNGGALHVGAGVPIAFYNGDPLAGGTQISTTLTSRPLAPGEYEDVTVSWLSPPLGPRTIYVVADDTGTGQGAANECDETNNVHSRGYIVWPDHVPDLILTNTVTPPVVTSGDLLTYTLIYSNAGPADAANVLLADILPDGVTPSAVNGLIPGSALTWTLGMVVAGEGGTIVLTATVNLTGALHAVFANMAVITTTTPESNMANNAALAVNELIQQADLVLSKTVTPPIVQPGDLLTYTLVYSNLGLADAASVVLSDTLPAGLLPTGVMTWPLGTLVAGENGTVLLTATVDVTSTAHATLTNMAIITTATPDSDAANNRAQAVNELIQMADLALSKTVTPAVVQSGDLLTYTLAFTNTGPATASNVILTDTLPPGLTPGGVLTWHLGAVPPGDGGILVMTATVDLTGTAYALLTNTALIAGSTPEAGYGNNTAQVASTLLQAADLRLTKSVEPAIAQAGAVLTYTLTFTNAGLANAAGLRITDTLPAAVTFGGMVEMEPSLFGPIVAEPTLAWYTGTLPAGATGSLAFTVAVLPDVWGVLTNTAVITSVTPEQNPADNQDMVTHLIEQRNWSIYLPVILKASRHVPYSVYLPIICKQTMP